MDKLPYQVFAPGGYPVLQAPESCRSSRRVELDQLAAGYTILLHGKRITRSDSRAAERGGNRNGRLGKEEGM